MSTDVTTPDQIGGKSLSYTMLKKPKLAWTDWLWVGLALIPPIAILWQIINYTIQVPYLDEIFFPNLLDKLYSNNLTLHDLWNQYNEHRIIIWRILALALAKAGGYNFLKENLFSFGAALLTLVLTWRLLRLTLPGLWQGPALFISSLLIFSFGQEENWRWGFQSGWFVVNLLILLTVLMLTYQPNNLRNFLIAWGAAVVATFTVGTALPIWPAVALAMLLNKQVWRWKYIGAWFAGAALAGAIYLYHYSLHNTETFVPQDKTYAFKHLPKTLIYFLNYLGAPLGLWNSAVQAAPWFGLVMLVLITLSSCWLGWLAWRRKVVAGWQASWPWLILILVAIGNAALTAISRVQYGPEQAFGGRYQTVAIWFWLGGGFILGLTVYQLGKLHAWKVFQRRLALAVVGLSLVGLLISFGFCSLTAYQYWIGASKALNSVQPFFYDYQNAPDNSLTILWGDARTIRASAAILEKYQQGTFATSKTQYLQQQKNQWESEIKNLGSHPVVYPGKLGQAVYGGLSLISADDSHVFFTHSGPVAADTRYELTQFYQQQGLMNSLVKKVPIEIEAQTARYVRVYYDIGHSFNLADQQTVLPNYKQNNLSYFQVVLPPNTQRIQVETLYPSTHARPEQLKLTLYVSS